MIWPVRLIVALERIALALEQSNEDGRESAVETREQTELLRKITADQEHRRQLDANVRIDQFAKEMAGITKQ